jgi:hypothetical protein
MHALLQIASFIHTNDFSVSLLLVSIKVFACGSAFGRGFRELGFNTNRNRMQAFAACAKAMVTLEL